jgi:DNA-binding transcriptional LysR family regulator
MKRINIGPDELETFLCVAELGSFRGAAHRLALSQPSVTNRIRRLESVLGVMLFNRTTRRVVLTDAGQRLRIRAEQTVESLRATVQELRSEAILKTGHVAIAAAASVATSVLPALIRRFILRHPNVRVSLTDGFDDSLLDRVRDGRSDLAIVHLNTRADDLKFEALFEDEILLVAPRNHVLAKSRAATLATIAKHPFLCPSENSPTWRLVTKTFKAKGLELTVSFETNNLFTLLGLVEAGLGLTFLPRIVVPRLNLDMVTPIRVTDVPLVRKISLVTLRDRALSPAAAAFAKALRLGLKQTTVTTTHS